MKKTIILLSAIAFTFASCDIDKKGEVEMPDVDVAVDVEEGNLPEFDVDWAEVNVGTKTKLVNVPKVQVVMEEEEVEVPFIDVNMPNDDSEKEELSIVAEAEFDNFEHELTIQEIRASQNRLYVISKLDRLETKLEGEVMRVQDQVELNAPDLDIKHIIVGDRPHRSFNNRYSYFTSMNDIPAAAKSAKVIYKKQ